MRILLWLLVSAAALFGAAPGALAQEGRSGALDFGLDVHHNTDDRNVLGVHARAMAVDRVPGTLVGRFGELYASFGVGLKGELLQYSLGIKLGVGVGTDYFVLFLASGLMTDGYSSIRDGSSKRDAVKPGCGIPITLGLWVDPFQGFYIYAMAEPSWSLGGGERRKTDPFLPFAWEMRLRGGFGLDIAQIHLRMEYTYHQVGPYPWHVVSVGFGLPARAMSKLGDEPL